MAVRSVLLCLKILYGFPYQAEREYFTTFEIHQTPKTMSVPELDEKLFKRILLEGYKKGKSETQNFRDTKAAADYIRYKIAKRYGDYSQFGIELKIKSCDPAIKILKAALNFNKEDGDPFEFIHKWFKEEFFPGAE